MEVEGHFAFRVTRNADLTLEEEEADDLLAAVELELAPPPASAGPCASRSTAPSTRRRSTVIQRELDLEDDDVYALIGPLDLERAVGRPRPRPPRPARPVVDPDDPAGLRHPDDDDERLDLVRRHPGGDQLLHHPYDSVQRHDRGVHPQGRPRPARSSPSRSRCYRTSGDSPIVRTLIRAQERGKQVAALVELEGPVRRAAQHRVDPKGWRRRASTSSTASSASRPTPRPASWCATSPTACGATATSAPGNYNQQHGPPLRGHRPAHLRPRHRRRPHPPVQLPHRLRPGGRATGELIVAPRPAGASWPELDPQRGGPGTQRAASPPR